MYSKLHRLYKKRLATVTQPTIRIAKNKDKKTVSSIAAFNSDGQLLFGIRNDDELWTLPGGHVEDGEDPRDAAVRELFEESGLKAGELEFLGDGYGGRYGDVHVFCYKAIVNGEPTGDNDPDSECSVWSWVDVSDGVPDVILENLHNKRNITLDLLDLLKKSASVNVVDESENDEFELSIPTKFPEGEQPNNHNLFPEMDHGKLKRVEGEFGLSLDDISAPSEGQGFIDNPADNKETDNISEDTDLKLGEVEAPYSGYPGPLPVDEDADKDYDILRGASVKMADLIKIANAEVENRIRRVAQQAGFNVSSLEWKSAGILALDMMHTATTAYVQMTLFSNMSEANIWYQGQLLKRLNINDLTLVNLDRLSHLLYKIGAALPGLIEYHNSGGKAYTQTLKQKESVALTDSGAVDQNSYDDATYTRQDRSIPRNPQTEKTIYRK